MDIEIIIGVTRDFDFSTPIFGALLQYPTTEGTINDYREFIARVHEAKALATVAADILSLAILTPPENWEQILPWAALRDLGYL